MFVHLTQNGDIMDYIYRKILRDKLRQDLQVVVMSRVVASM